MERLNVTQVEQNLPDLLNRVYRQGTSVELERNGKVIARLVPVQPTPSLRAEDLPTFLASLPRLVQLPRNRPPLCHAEAKPKHLLVLQWGKQTLRLRSG